MTNAAAVPVAGPTPFWVKFLAVLVAIPAIVFSIVVAIGFTAFIDGVSADRVSHASGPLAADQAVQIDVNQGGVTVVAGPDGVVSVDDRLTVRAPTRDLAHRVLDAYTPSLLEQTATGVRVTVAGPPPGFAVSRSQDVTVHIPAAARLRLNVATGGADVRGLSGDLDLTAATGGFQIRDLTVSGQVRVSAGTGGIAVGPGTRMAGGTLDLSANSGGIDVQLPSDTNARYDISAATGGLSVEGPGNVNRSAGGVDQRLTGVLGDGSGGLIHAHAATGGISITARHAPLR